MLFFVNEEIETMKHLMRKCKHVTSFWREVTHWLRDLNIILNVPYMKICFGIYDTDYSTFVNMLLILAKKYIYKCRVQETKVYFPDFFSLKRLKNILQ